MSFKKKKLAKFLESMIRVNYEGEHGAVRLYQGKKFVLKDSDASINHMYKQEQEHLKFFYTWMIKNRIQPSFFHPIWHVGAWGLGTLSAYGGKHMAHACTMAVEEVIDKHYQHQIETLSRLPPSQSINILRQHIERFQSEEQEHHAIALQEGEREIKGFSIFSSFVRILTEKAIEVSKRF